MGRGAGFLAGGLYFRLVHGADGAAFHVAAVADGFELEARRVVVGPFVAVELGLVGLHDVPEREDRLLEVLFVEGRAWKTIILQGGKSMIS
jgi:hypothetical protein